MRNACLVYLVERYQSTGFSCLFSVCSVYLVYLVCLVRLVSLVFALGSDLGKQSILQDKDSIKNKGSTLLTGTIKIAWNARNVTQPTSLIGKLLEA